MLKNRKNVVIIVIVILVVVALAAVVYFALPKKDNVQYKVVFANSENVVLETITINGNEKIKKPDDPQKDGYEFIGWYYEGKLFDFDTVITSDIYLEAKWKEVKNENVDKSISFLKSNVTLEVGEAYKAEVKVVGMETFELNWSSSDKKVATVNNKGIINAVAKGTIKITAQVLDTDLKAVMTVTVNNGIVKVDGIALNSTSLEMNIGDKYKLIATVKPINAYNKSVEWTSSDSNVVKVDSAGSLQALALGEATITAKTRDGAFKASCKVIVKEKELEYKIILKPIIQEGIQVMQYSVEVVKKSVPYKEYSYIIYGGKKVVSTVSVVHYDTNINTAVIKLNNGQEVTAEVVYK